MKLEEARILAQTDGRVSQELREHKCNHFDEVVETLEGIARHENCAGKQSPLDCLCQIMHDAKAVLEKAKEVKI